MGRSVNLDSLVHGASANDIHWAKRARARPDTIATPKNIPAE